MGLGVGSPSSDFDMATLVFTHGAISLVLACLLLIIILFCFVLFLRQFLGHGCVYLYSQDLRDRQADVRKFEDSLVYILRSSQSCPVRAYLQTKLDRISS